MVKKLIFRQNNLFDKILLSIFFCSVFCVSDAFSQNKVKGIILDQTGEAAIGVGVQNKRNSVGTATDLDGNFELEANLNDVLVISHVSYKKQEYVVKDFSPIKIVMESDIKSLDEVIVIGYGTQKKSDVSGSVTTVNGDKLTQMSRAGAAESLQGMAPGLSINYGSGAPGSQPSLQVRGLTSWGSSNEPLVIIDGVPSDISYLNPEDIKSMTVLKDAATAAVYGSRAAAGVILIETKRGDKQKPKITASAYIGMDDLPKMMDVCNAEEFIKVRKMALENAGISPGSSGYPAYIKAYEQDPSKFADTDWQREYFRRGLTQKYDIGYIAGSEFMNVAFSGYYSSTKGIAVGTDSRKYGFRLNSDITRGKFKIGESVSINFIESRPEEGSGFGSLFQLMNMEPIASVYDANNDGGYGGAIEGMGMSDAANQIAFNNLIDTKTKNNKISASAYIQYQPINDLTFKFQGGTNINYYHYKSFIPTYKIGAAKINNVASLYEEKNRQVETIMELTGNYNTTFAEKHNFSAMLGASMEESRLDNQIAQSRQFENNEQPWLSLGQTGFAAKGEYTRFGLMSGFARLNYNYDYRYLFMFTARYDGSSRFADGNKWGFFPSASIGWNVANENFWSNVKDVVSTFKIRASYGVLGNQSIGNYKYIQSLDSNNNYLNYPFNGNTVDVGYGVRYLASPDIRWESTMHTNFGFDMGFWNNKLELSAEGYLKNTFDMLSNKYISPSTGYESILVNDGKLRTAGVEIQAIYHGTAGDKFRYDLDLNLSHFKSVLVDMADKNYVVEDGPARSYVGGEIGEFWVIKTDGIFQNQKEVDDWNTNHGYTDESGVWQPMQPGAKPGDIRFIDQNGDGMIDSGDRVKAGSGIPKVVMGLNINLSYGQFDLIANFYGNFGVKRYNFTKLQLERMDKVFNYGKAALDAWTPENPNTNIPRAVQGDPNNNAREDSDRFLENGDFLTLNNLQFGYNLPKDICKKIMIDNLRIYIAGSRLFTITNYSGYDPTTGAISNGSDDSSITFMGVDRAAYPLSRTYMLGLKFGF